MANTIIRRGVLKSKWLVRVRFLNNSELVYMINVEELRAFMAGYEPEYMGSKMGIINKYLFPCVFERFKDKIIKSIKIKGDYGS